jgi:hypothetical protein
MFKFLDKLLWPHRVAKGASCNIGFWWFIPALMNALGSIGGAIGGIAGSAASAIGSAASAVGGAIGSGASAIGSLFGGGSAAAGTAGSAIGTAAGTGSSIGALAPAATTLANAGIGGAATGIGAAAPIGSLAATQGAGMTGLLSGAGGAAGAGSLAPGLTAAIAPGATNALLTKAGVDTTATVAKETLMKKLGDQVLTAGVSKMTEGAGPQPAPAMGATNTDNSISMSSPQTGDAGSAPTSGGNNQTSLSPEQMMQLVQMIKQQQVQGGTRPIAKGQFPGGYY